MQTNERNKMITSAENKAPAPLLEYHFAGSGEYLPQTVHAKNKAEAEAEWKETRKPLRSEPLEESN